MGKRQPKWCTHCRKDNHNDNECWSTRVVTLQDHPVQPSGQLPPFRHHDSQLDAAIRRTAQELLDKLKDHL